MLLKKITLNNIRSYKSQEIDFVGGSTLLSGDIGSGKTSVLLGIEFALFGLQPGQRGSSLLRNGEESGGVIIEFEVDGKLIVVERTLKKGKTVSQDFCAITIDEERKETSVTELKNKVLELLNYPKEFSKKQNLLYKFTVYTPQEEMKQIILQDSETRLNTLRHVFGIDKYKKILENVSLLGSKLREEKRRKEGMTANLEQDKLQLAGKEDELKTKYSDLSLIESDFFLKIEQRKKSQEEKDLIAKKIDEKRELEKEIEKSKIMDSTKKETLFINEKKLKELEIQIKELETLKFDEVEILNLEKGIQLNKKEKIELDEKNLQITTQIHSLTNKNQDDEEIKKRISHIEVCPTCLQDVDSTYKANVVNKVDSNISKNVNSIKELTLEKRKISEEILKINENISVKERKIQELNILKIKYQGVEDKKKQLNEIEKNNFLIKRDSEMLEKQIEMLKANVFELSKYDNIFEEKRKLLEESLREEKMAEIKVAELKREIEVFSMQIDELKKRLEETEKIKESLKYISELEDWVSQKFSPVISHIEKNVMIKLKVEFSRVFSEWFSMLVSENFNISLKDDFTPLIEQQDYEIDYAYLSGGERTAIALAYRLALNQVINSLLSKIKTRDLVILDEPTDGFSEQQLDKMRDVFHELDIAQLIIVSHEQKIEGFVENVIKFRKENGISLKE
jgi:DNA repair protein SbcC/Rad50